MAARCPKQQQEMLLYEQFKVSDELCRQAHEQLLLYEPDSNV